MAYSVGDIFLGCVGGDPASLPDAYVRHLDSSGTLIETLELTGSGTAVVRGIGVSAAGRLYVLWDDLTAVSLSTFAADGTYEGVIYSDAGNVDGQSTRSSIVGLPGGNVVVSAAKEGTLADRVLLIFDPTDTLLATYDAPFSGGDFGLWLKPGSTDHVYLADAADVYDVDTTDGSSTVAGPTPITGADYREQAGGSRTESFQLRAADAGGGEVDYVADVLSNDLTTIARSSGVIYHDTFPVSPIFQRDAAVVSPTADAAWVAVNDYSGTPTMTDLYQAAIPSGAGALITSLEGEAITGYLFVGFPSAATYVPTFSSVWG